MPKKLCEREGCDNLLGRGRQRFCSRFCYHEFGRSVSMIDGKVYEYILRHKAEHDGVPPTVRQMQHDLGAASTFTVHNAKKRLVEDGKIRIVGGMIEVVGARWLAPGNTLCAHSEVFPQECEECDGIGYAADNIDVACDICEGRGESETLECVACGEIFEEE